MNKAKLPRKLSLNDMRVFNFPESYRSDKKNSPSLSVKFRTLEKLGFKID